jgi:hypothetical protein
MTHEHLPGVKQKSQTAQGSKRVVMLTVRHGWLFKYGCDKWHSPHHNLRCGSSLQTS